MTLSSFLTTVKDRPKGRIVLSMPQVCRNFLVVFNQKWGAPRLLMGVSGLLFALWTSDVQTMVFEGSDNGPWWMLSEEGREAWRLDIYAPADNVGRTKLANRMKLQLANAPKEETGVTVDPLRPMNEIKEYAIRHRVDLQYCKIHLTEGWLGKQKGLLQILWERGWIDPCKCASTK